MLNTAFVVVFVPVFLAAMLIANLDHFTASRPPLHAEAAQLMKALGTDQYWTMFGAYFPAHVRVPVVRVVLKGGRQVFLPPFVGPEFSPQLAARFDLENLPEEARTAGWRGNFGTGRIEKYESRASSAAPGWLGVRTAYAASQLRRWVGDDAALAARIRFVDLLSVAVASARDGKPLTVISVDPRTIEPAFLAHWPAPRSRQLNSGGR